MSERDDDDDLTLDELRTAVCTMQRGGVVNARVLPILEWRGYISQVKEKLWEITDDGLRLIGQK